MPDLERQIARLSETVGATQSTVSGLQATMSSGFDEMRRTMAAQEGLPGTTVEELWRIKNEFILGRLEIAAQAGLTAPQRAAMQTALADQTRSRVSVLVRPEALQPGNEALAWLPSRR